MLVEKLVSLLPLRYQKRRLPPALKRLTEACRNHLGWPSSTRVENDFRRCPAKFKKVVDPKLKLEKWLRKSCFGNPAGQHRNSL